MNATIEDLLNRLDTLPFDQAHTLVLHVLDTDPGMIEDDRVRRWVSANSKAILDVVRRRVERYEALGNAAQDHIVDDVLTGNGKETERLLTAKTRRQQRDQRALDRLPGSAAQTDPTKAANLKGIAHAEQTGALPQTTRASQPSKRLRHPDTCQCPACRPFIYPRR